MKTLDTEPLVVSEHPIATHSDTETEDEHPAKDRSLAPILGLGLILSLSPGALFAPSMAAENQPLAPTAVLTETYHYDDAGRLIEVIYDDGRGIQYTYDAASNLISITTTQTFLLKDGFEQ